MIQNKIFFFYFVNVFLLFDNYLPSEKSGALHFNKLKFPSPKDALCQVWLKLIQWFLRRRFCYIVNVFLLFDNYLPLEKGGALHLNKLEFPLPRVLCAKFNWNWSSGSGEEDENVKSLQTDGRTDRQRTTNDQKSSFELSAQLSLKQLLVSLFMFTFYAFQIWLQHNLKKVSVI